MVNVRGSKHSVKGLVPCGGALWAAEVPETRSGVYRRNRPAVIPFGAFRYDFRAAPVPCTCCVAPEVFRAGERAADAGPERCPRVTEGDGACPSANGSASTLASVAFSPTRGVRLIPSRGRCNWRQAAWAWGAAASLGAGAVLGDRKD